MSRHASALLETEQYQRFYTLVFDAAIERDPVTATHDYLFENRDSLEASISLLQDELRIVFLRRVTYGKSALTQDEIQAISDALTAPDDAAIEAARELLVDHLALSETSPSNLSGVFQKLFSAMDNPKRAGRKSTAYASRNHVICSAVNRLMKAGLTKIGQGQSACQIVSDEMCKLGFPLSIDGVRKVLDGAKPGSVNPEEVDMVIAKASEGFSQKELQERKDAWDRLEEIGKKEGYIPSSDAS
ncbi:hypothetical protein [uncultured Sulfitobacter sp.]|uniref:hypothetical protein n=1 Tax=uncultured Sulfitobacter sp. TaxID=191468 RepID=UPI00260E415E|nr:hypothetical protein [uncultured Sulfitobacter sp.]